MHQSIFILLMPALLVACAKETEPPRPSSLTVINAVVGASQLSVNFSGTGKITYLTGIKMSYGRYTLANNRFTSPYEIQPLGLFLYPDTLTGKTPMYNMSLPLPAGSASTLFLTGTVDMPDSLLIRETIPFYEAPDSTMGIRFINLSAGSNPVSVNIAGQADGSEVTNLSYKSRTEFKRYQAKTGMVEYVFEFRDATTGAFIESYTTQAGSDDWLTSNTWRYRNLTLALIGKPGGTGSAKQKLLLIPH